MTKEEFESLEVGSVVCLFGDSKFEIVEKRVNGHNNFDIMLSCKSLFDNSDLYFLHKHCQFYMTANIDLKKWLIFDISNLKFVWSNNQEQNSIEHFQKKIEETKSELVRLETTLKGLEDSKRMKELTETLSNLILGDFYTVNVEGRIFTGKYIGTNADKSHTFYLLTNNNYTASQRHIKQIIHRPNFSEDYRILLKKIDTFNKDLENA